MCAAELKEYTTARAKKIIHNFADPTSIEIHDGTYRMNRVMGAVQWPENA